MGGCVSPQLSGWVGGWVCVCVCVYLLKVFSISLFCSQKYDYRPFIRGTISKYVSGFFL